MLGSMALKGLFLRVQKKVVLFLRIQKIFLRISRKICGLYAHSFLRLLWNPQDQLAFS